MAIRPECAAAIQAAAGDRKLTDADMRAIELRLAHSARTLKMQNPEAWDNMLPADRVAAAAKLARQSHLADIARAHTLEMRRVAIKARRDAETFAVPAGKQLAALDAVHFTSGARTNDTSLEAEIEAEAARVKTMLTGKEERALDVPEISNKVAHELFGEDSGDGEAKAIAGKLKKHLANNVQRMQDAGIAINPLDSWRLPQHQEWTRLTAKGEQEWIDDHKGWIDHRMYVNPDGSSMSPEQLDHLLHESWLTIQTDGANKRAAGTGHSGGGRVGGQVNAPRQLHYKDADSYLAAMTKYGTAGNVGQLFRAHMGRTARMIAIASKEGPLADRDVVQRADQALANDLRVANSKREKQNLKAAHDAFLLKWKVQQHGGTGQPGNPRIAAAMSFTRNLLRSTMLGSLVSQVPSDQLAASTLLKAWGFDLGAGRFTKRFLEGSTTGPRLKDDMRALGVWNDHAHAQTTRYLDEEIHNKASRFLSGTVYKMSGMRRADFATTGAMVDTVLGTIGRDVQAHASVADLPDAPGGQRSYAQRFGISQDHWDVMRASKLDEGLDHGNGYVTPAGIYAVPDEALQAIAARRAQASGADVATETRLLRDETVRKLAAIEQEVLHSGGRGFSGATLNEKASLGQIQNAPGTFGYEIAHMLAMIRQTPFGMMRANLFDVPRGLEGGWAPKAKYIAKYMAGQMAATAFYIQAKHLIGGEDPENMLTPTFLAKMGAGALSSPMLAAIVFGNLGEGQNDAGRFLGPGANALGDLYNLVMRGRDPGKKFAGDKYGSQWLSFVRSNLLPFGNMWWTKSALNALIYREAQEAISPGYNERVQKRLEHEGRTSWWSEGAPDRAPDFGAALGQPAQ